MLESSSCLAEKVTLFTSIPLLPRLHFSATRSLPWFAWTLRELPPIALANRRINCPALPTTCWGATAPTGPSTYYAKASSRNVYPGIDLVYYGTQGQLEYDFVLSPQADPSKIRIEFAGATPMIDGSGDLVLKLGTKDGQSDIRFHSPVVYQEAGGIRRPVSGRFTIAANHQVGFEVGAYDRTQQLVIDPKLVYSSYLGGSTQQSVINALAVNANGDIYVTGVTNALDYPTTKGVIETTCPPGNPNLGGKKCGPSSASAAFVSKISADGQSLIYSTYLGGGGVDSSNDQGTGIAVDAGDNAWVVGRTQSNDFPDYVRCIPGLLQSGGPGLQLQHSPELWRKERLHRQ